jgi:hypothetical protein
VALTLGKYVSSGKSFYYLKGVTSPGAVIAQVRELITSLEETIVVVQSSEEDSDGSESSKTSSDIASQSYLENCETDTEASVDEQSVPVESGPSLTGASGKSDTFEAEDRRHFHYLMLKLKSQMVESVQMYQSSGSTVNLSYDAANDLVPPLLFNILAYLVADISSPPEDTNTKYELDRKTKEIVLNLGQDIIHQAFHIATAKQIALLVHLFHKSRSKSNIQLMNRLGYGVSHQTLKRLLTSAALAVEERIRQVGVYIPDGFGNALFSNFVCDNLDWSVSIVCACKISF